MRFQKSQREFARAQEIFPGGVNSPVRAFGSVGGTPPFIVRGRGSRLWDLDGNEYIDYVNSWGPAILGHAHPGVVAVLKHAAEQGLSFGAPTELETELAEMIRTAVPSMEMLRFVSSGTEATMSAVRLARGFTGRNKILKFEGCYHGHADSLLVKAGSGAATHGEPTSAGVAQTTAAETIVSRYNDLHHVADIMHKNGASIAAIIVEPVAGNMGCILPREGFLQGLRALCDQHGALLIFDEVMTGFRIEYGGVQKRFNVQPDITCLGKVIGGGLPVGAYGGRREIMQQVAPLGPVYQAGTLSGNPLAMSVGIETLKLLAHEGTYEQLEAKTERLVRDIGEALTSNDIPHQINAIGSMWSLFFTDQPVVDFESAIQGNRERFNRFFHAMLDHGIYLAPSPFESAFLSLAHTEEDLKETTAQLWSWAKVEEAR